jgi:DNA modification methylase
MKNPDTLPDDYEPCGTCGFDHEYEPEAAQKKHIELEEEALLANQKGNITLSKKPFPECLEDVGSLLPLVYIDPPYGGIVNQDWDKQSADNYIRICQQIAPHLVTGGSLYVWGGIGKYKSRIFFEFLSRVESETPYKLANVITWSKKRAYGKSNDYLFTREELAWLVLGDEPRTFHVPLLEEKRGYAGYNAKYPAKSEFKRRTNVWTDVTEILRGKRHPTEKPSQLARIVTEIHTEPGELVADFFAGSGSTASGVTECGRHCFLAESNDDYWNQIQMSYRVDVL